MLSTALSLFQCVMRVRIDVVQELPLYGSGGIRFLWDTKFDQAMVAFLDCLQQFKEVVEVEGNGFSLPYK